MLCIAIAQGLLKEVATTSGMAQSLECLTHWLLHCLSYANLRIRRRAHLNLTSAMIGGQTNHSNQGAEERTAMPR